MSDASVTLGLDAKEFDARLAALEAKIQGLGKTATTAFGGLKNALGSFGAGLGAAAISAELLKVVNMAHEIHHESERFGIDAQQLQMIGNAAKEDGVSLESTARAMSRLIFAENEAVKGGGKMAEAFTTLGINLGNFIHLAPDEKMLALADALKKAGLNTQTYTAIAEILGKRFGAELIPTLMKGSEAIKESSKEMGIFGNVTVESLEKAHKAFEQFGNSVQVIVGNYLTTAIRGLRGQWVFLKQDALLLRDVTVGAWHEMERAMHMDFKGAGAEWSKAMANMRKDIFESKQEYDAIMAGPAAARKLPGQAGAFDPDALEKLGKGTTTDKESNAAVETMILGMRLAGEDQLAKMLQTRLALEEKINKAKEEGQWAVVKELQMQMKLTEEIERRAARDKHHLSLAELANEGAREVGFGGGPGHGVGDEARRALALEEQGRRAELSGREADAEKFYARADQIKGGIGTLKDSEKNQFDSSTKVGELVNQAREIAKNTQNQIKVVSQ